MTAIQYAGFVVGDAGQFQGAENAGADGQLLTLSDATNRKTNWGGVAQVGDPLKTGTGTRQFEVKKGGTGGSEAFFVTNRDGAYFDVGIDRFVNVQRDSFPALQVGVGGGGVPTIRTANDNLPLLFQARGTTDSFGGSLFLLNRTDPNDPALTPLVTIGVGLAHTSISRRDVEVFTGLQTVFNFGIHAPNLPVTDPAVAGAFWNDAGTLKVSAG